MSAGRGGGTPALALPQEQDPDLDPPPGQPPIPAGRDRFPGTPPEPFPGAGASFPGTLPGGAAGTVPAGQRAQPGAALAGTVVPAIKRPGHRISTAAHVLLSVREWAARMLASQKNHRGFWRWLWYQFAEKPPESLCEVGGYLGSRQWLENYMTGWLRAFCEWENIAWLTLVAIPFTAVLGTLLKVVQRQSRFWATVLLLCAALIIWLLAHH